MTQKRLYLIVGLGNPGDKYADTRHNVGFLVVDGVAESYSIPINKTKFNVIFGRGFINDGREAILAKPMAFMNRSGPPILSLAKYFRVPCEDMLVIHDDIDLTFERLKITMKGGHGGHNGVRSLIDAFGGGDFSRLRLGVGHPEVPFDAADHVLGKFSIEEKKMLPQLITRARDAVVTIVCNGINEGMNKFNY